MSSRANIAMVGPQEDCAIPVPATSGNSLSSLLIAGDAKTPPCVWEKNSPISWPYSKSARQKGSSCWLLKAGSISVNVSRHNRPLIPSGMGGSDRKAANSSGPCNPVTSCGEIKTIRHCSGKSIRQAISPLAAFSACPASTRNPPCAYPFNPIADRSPRPHFSAR